MKRSIVLVVFVATATAAIVALSDVSVVQAAIAAVAAAVLMVPGLWIIRLLAAPVPEPPDPGELRKVKLVYRCEVCGSEVRMTAANRQDPEPPRHCMDEMTLVTPIE